MSNRAVDALPWKPGELACRGLAGTTYHRVGSAYVSDDHKAVVELPTLRQP